MRRQVYFNEFNVLMDDVAYLPLVSGLLRAYAETHGDLTAAYEFRPFLFYRDQPAQILAAYDEPAVAAFSTSMWNEQLNLHVAREVKRRHPDCLIVFGGPQVPHHPEDYFAAHPFIDVAVRGEGEEAFADVLRRGLVSREFAGLPGVSWREPATGRCIRNVEERPQSRDLDLYPSPYLEGLFDELMTRKDLRFQAIIETNRGCPFPCTFCFWGQGGLSRKYRFHGLERVQRELAWCAEHRIAYVFNADSNFGMHKRDLEIAQMLVELKERHGFPEKFRTCFGKNTDDKIYEIAVLLHRHGLEKGITLARQSNDEDVLRNVKRQNIKLATYENLQRRFNEGDVPVYTELILGLPGETYASWVRGIDELLQSGLKNQLFVYLAQVFPNTDLADPEHQRQFGIRTRRILLTEIHGGIRPAALLPEYEDVIVETVSMSVDDWRRMAVFSWVTMLLHSLKLGFFLMAYLADRFGVRYGDLLDYVSNARFPDGTGRILREEVGRFEVQLDRLLAGGGRGHHLPEFGNLYWDEEEASFLRISEQLDAFYDELGAIVRAFLSARGIDWDEAELAEAIRYQRVRIPTCAASGPPTVRFAFNFPEYFATRFRSESVPLRRTPQILTVAPREYDGDRMRYARETILWGRKSGTMLTEVRWRSADAAGRPRPTASVAGAAAS